MSFSAELEAACRIARAAGQVILAQRAEGSSDLDGASAELASEACITEALSEDFGSDALLSARRKDDAARLGNERVWMIDGLDGLREYENASDEYTVVMGLVENGEPVIGVVYQPATDTLFFASAGGGAFVVRGDETTPLTVSELTNPAGMVLVVSRSHRDSRVNDVRNLLGIGNETASGSVGLKIGLIADQRCDLYVHPTGHTKIWDTCGPQVILIEAGGSITDCYGEFLHYNRKNVVNHRGVVASNGHAHDELVEAASRAMRGDVNDDDDDDDF